MLTVALAGSWTDAFRDAREALQGHYRNEDRWLGGISPKMLAQHDEARELAAAVEQSIAAGQPEDALQLVRRFLAIAQHNMIEEERDVFPLVH